MSEQRIQEYRDASERVALRQMKCRAAVCNNAADIDGYCEQCYSCVVASMGDRPVRELRDCATCGIPVWATRDETPRCYVCINRLQAGDVA